MSPWRRFVDWLHAPEPAAWLGLTRVAVALVAAYNVAWTWASGAHAWVWYDRADGGYRVLRGPWWFDLVGGDPLAVQATMAGGIGACLLLAAGVGGPVLGRVIGLVAAQLFLALSDRNGQAGGSYDLLTAASLWLMVLAGGTQTLSVHAWRRTGRWHDPDAVAPRWTRLLVAWQLLVMYATTGWQKVSVHWVPGGDLSALYDILQQPTWSRADRLWLSHPVAYAATQVGTLVSWLWEVLTPIWGLWWLAATAQVDLGRLGRALVAARVGLVWAAVGAVFHLAVHVLMEIGPFSWASLALYAAMASPEGVARIVSGRGGR